MGDIVEEDAARELVLHGGLPDLVFCRHLFWHLPPNDNLRVLRNIEGMYKKRTGLVMLSTRLRADQNLASFVLAIGHPVNLFRPPYCVRDPLRLFRDSRGQHGFSDYFMGLWRVGPDEPPLMGREEDGECMFPGFADPHYS